MASSSVPVHFFDIDSTLLGSDRSWSPNTLRIRMVLNYKGIPYTQSWVSYPDIRPLLKNLSVPPNAGEIYEYTLPAIVHPSCSTLTNHSTVLMDSLAIAIHLEEVFPSPSLFPSGNASYALALSTHTVISNRGWEYFVETRSREFGKPLAEVRPKDEETVKRLGEDAEGKLGKEGPFLEGERISYGDFYIVSYLAWFQRVERKLWEKMVSKRSSMLGRGS
ncbi:hypothetical protein OIDMADRAFT_106317 [Oidiodendron maius Zn]|uniref:GST N-terminal domain-containing protein n=1 Tax=Oidiodendron maius (strain Zn) TaxID=913774 RepID=A0A0C3GZU3_OIDMZ|nr:hypothetical protein OIDMADRAFT_106317 [Oidiodendron maius Zn]